jgi:hypothetical protein
MKEYLKRKFEALKNLYASTIKPKIDAKIKASGPVVSFLILAGVVIVGVALFLAAIAAVVFVMVLLPGMVVGFFVWFAWTYMQLGLTYFPSLPPVYQTIPYWHFAWGFAALILLWKIVRKSPAQRRAAESKNVTINNSRS